MAALKAAGNPHTYLIGVGYNHFELPETYGNPYGILGRAALELMGLKPHHGQRNNGGRSSSVRRLEPAASTPSPLPYELSGTFLMFFA